MTRHINSEVTHAAVLLHTDEHWLLQLRDDKPTIIQPGAISLWGGEREKADTSPEATALRELRDETGLLLTPNELEALEPLDYIENRMDSDGNTEELKICSQVFLVYRQNIAPFSVREGQGLLYVALARLFLPESANLHLTQELDLTAEHLKEIKHPIVAKALGLQLP